MDRLTRKVLARYMGDPDGGPHDHDKSWMEYVQDEVSGLGKPSRVVMKMLENKKQLDEPFNTTNPYDYTDPDNQSKDQKDSPPFENEIDPSTQKAYFMVPPSLWKDQGALEEWGKATHIDPTEDEDTQYPALSCTRRLASAVVGLYTLENHSVHVAPHELDEFLMMARTAATLSEVANRDHHYKNDLKIQRSAALSPVLVSTPQEKSGGLFRYKVQSPGSPAAQTVFIQMMRGDKKDITSYADYPMKLACTCPSFLYHGAHFYATAGGYVFEGAFRKKVAPPPKPQDQYVVHVSPFYPRGKRHPGRGENFTMCKHIVAVYDMLSKEKIEHHYREYPTKTPPSKIMNREVWKNLMKFDFTEANIKQRLMGARPKIPDYFNTEKITPDIIEWFTEVWEPATEQEKIETIKKMVESPERIFFVLLKEASLQRRQNATISARLVSEGYQLMEKVVQPENMMTPEQVEMPGVPEEEKTPNMGTGISAPGGTKPAAEFIEEATQPVTSLLKKPKKTLQERQQELRERGLSDKERQNLKRFEEEEMEPRKEKLRQQGKRPLFNE